MCVITWISTLAPHRQPWERMSLHTPRKIFHVKERNLLRTGKVHVDLDSCDFGFENSQRPQDRSWCDHICSGHRTPCYHLCFSRMFFSLRIYLMNTKETKISLKLIRERPRTGFMFGFQEMERRQPELYLTGRLFVAMSDKAQSLLVCHKKLVEAAWQTQRSETELEFTRKFCPNMTLGWLRWNTNPPPVQSLILGQIKFRSWRNTISNLQNLWEKKNVLRLMFDKN